MRVMEHWIRSKQGPKLDDCEDDWVVTENYACVMDGATSPTGRRWTPSQWTGGQWAVQVLKAAIQNLSSLSIVENNEDASRQLVAYLTSCLHEAYVQEPGALEVMETQPEERATASLVLYSQKLRLVILVGDCQVGMVDDQGNMVQRIQHTRYIDTVTSQARAMFWQAEVLLANPKSSSSCLALDEERDPGRDLIQPLLVRQRRFQNNPKAPKPYRYWALDGFPIEPEGIHVHDIPESVTQLILASDGYPKLYSTLDETEAYLKEILQEDPMLMDRLPSTKGVRKGMESFDDRTYLRIEL